MFFHQNQVGTTTKIIKIFNFEFFLDKNLEDVVIPSVCWWRTLFPSFDTFISDGSITFGNNHLPNSLCKKNCSIRVTNI